MFSSRPSGRLFYFWRAEKIKIRISRSWFMSLAAWLSGSHWKVIDRFHPASYIAPEFAVHQLQVFPETVVPGNETGSRCVR
jgi:hypothetical protein